MQKHLTTDLKNLSDDQWWSGFKGALELTVQGLAELAAFYAEGVRRGKTAEMRGILRSTGRDLLAVASGRLLPQAYLKLMGCATAIDRVSLLVPSEQQRLVEKGSVVVVRPGHPKGEIVPLEKLTASDVKTAFDVRTGRVLSVKEQEVTIKKNAKLELHKLTLVLSETEFQNALKHAQKGGMSMHALFIAALRRSNVI